MPSVVNVTIDERTNRAHAVFSDGQQREYEAFKSYNHFGTYTTWSLSFEGRTPERLSLDARMRALAPEVFCKGSGKFVNYTKRRVRPEPAAAAEYDALKADLDRLLEEYAEEQRDYLIPAQNFVYTDWERKAWLLRGERSDVAKGRKMLREAGLELGRAYEVRLYGEPLRVIFSKREDEIVAFYAVPPHKEAFVLSGFTAPHPEDIDLSQRVTVLVSKMQLPLLTTGFKPRNFLQ